MPTDQPPPPLPLQLVGATGMRALLRLAGGSRGKDQDRAKKAVEFRRASRLSAACVVHASFRLLLAAAAFESGLRA